MGRKIETKNVPFSYSDIIARSPWLCSCWVKPGIGQERGSLARGSGVAFSSLKQSDGTEAGIRNQEVGCFWEAPISWPDDFVPSILVQAPGSFGDSQKENTGGTPDKIKLECHGSLRCIEVKPCRSHVQSWLRSTKKGQTWRQMEEAMLRSKSETSIVLFL